MLTSVGDQDKQHRPLNQEADSVTQQPESGGELSGEGEGPVSSGLEREVAELKDLFLRRLYEDKVRLAQHGALVEQLQWARDALDEKSVEALARELLLALDRLEVVAEDNPQVLSVCEEIRDVLQIRGLEKIDDSGLFDPALHEAIRSVQVTTNLVDGEIVDVLRTGYTFRGRLLRPTQVVVAVGDFSSQAGSDADAVARDSQQELEPDADEG